MSELRDLPDMITDLVELSKEYLRQEAFGPARRVGKVTAFSLGGALLVGVGLVLISVAGMRAVVSTLPEAWTWAGYLISALVLGGAGAGILWMGRR